MAAVPEGVERVGVAGGIPGDEGLRDDGVGAAGAGEAGGLGETAELDRDVAGALDLVDGVGDCGVADVGLVRAVEEDDSLVLLRVFHPRGELGLGGDGAGRVVREAEVDQVGGDRRHGRHVAVGGRALEVGDALVTAVDVGAGAARHDVGVDVDRVNGVGNREADVVGEDFLDVAAVALRAVGDEDFVGVDLAAAGGVIVLLHGLAQERVTLLRAVALEGGALRHLVGRGMERLDAHRRQRLGDVTDAEADHRLGRIGGDVGADALGDVAKEVGRLELGVVFVDADHGGGGRRRESGCRE